MRGAGDSGGCCTATLLRMPVVHRIVSSEPLVTYTWFGVPYVVGHALRLLVQTCTLARVAVGASPAV